MQTTRYQWALVLDGIREDTTYEDEDNIIRDAKVYKAMFPSSNVKIEQRRVADNGSFGRWENYLAQHAGKPYENVPDTSSTARSRP